MLGGRSIKKNSSMPKLFGSLNGSLFIKGCVCMCVFMCTCMCMHTCICMCARIYAYISMCLQVHMWEVFTTF